MRHHFVLLGVALHEAALDDAVLEAVEADLHLVAASRAVALHLLLPGLALFRRLLHAEHVGAPVVVEPLEVDGVERVVHALEPVAGELHRDDPALDVVPLEEVPAREHGRRRRPHVREDDARLLLDGVRLDADLVLELGAFRLGRLVDALPGLIEDPAVVGAADAVLFRYAVGEVGLAVGARRLDEAERALRVAVENEVLAEDAYFLRGVVDVQLGARGDWGASSGASTRPSACPALPV